MPTVNLKLPEGERPAPEPLNYFQFSRVGVEVQMLAGWIDLQRAAAAMDCTWVGSMKTRARNPHWPSCCR